MSIAAFILARKNSKRLSNKNTKLLCGKPLIEWTVDVAIESGVIDTLIVGTDDENIEKICLKYNIKKGDISKGEALIQYTNNIEIIDLPNYLTTDNAPQTEALLYCMDKIEKHDYIMLLQPTSPLRTSEDIKNILAYRRYLNLGYNSLVSTDDNSKYKDKSNGMFYISKWEVFFEHRNFNGQFFYKMKNSVDINIQEDFDKAKFLMQEKLKSKD